MGTPSKDIYHRLSSDRYRAEAIADLVEIYQKHKSLDVVAASLGVSTRTVYRWIERWPDLAKALEDQRQ